MGITRRALGLVAEKNLLKLVLTNKHTSLQVVNTRSGDTFLQATTQEQAVIDRIPSDCSTSDRRAAKAVATVLAERAAAVGLGSMTWERRDFRRAPGQYAKAKYTPGTKVAVIIDTLRKKGIEFVSHLRARGEVDMQPILLEARRLSALKREETLQAGGRVWPSARQKTTEAAGDA